MQEELKSRLLQMDKIIRVMKSLTTQKCNHIYIPFLQLKASDKDGDTKLEYNIVRVTNNGKRIFQLNPRNGKLDLIGPVKAGEHYAITVEVIDSGEKSSQGKILR